MLVDTGCAHTAPELLRWLEQADRGGERVERIVNSHTHEDHIGANGPLQRRRPDLEILAHPLALPVLADPAGCQPLHPYRRLFWGWPTPSRAQPLEEGSRVQAGPFCFQVLYTPGHTVDHLCLWEPERGWLFSGDLFVGGKDRALRAGYDIWDIIASLKKVAALPVKTLFPGSARVREENPLQQLSGKIAYLEDLGGRVLELNERGWSVGAIARQLCGGPLWIEAVTLGHFTRRNLVRSYLGENTDW
jgi:glyoxylase-like metal-dependent hydrolase (beta-lactamase superfamily II)